MDNSKIAAVFARVNVKLREKLQLPKLRVLSGSLSASISMTVAGLSSLQTRWIRKCGDCAHRVLRDRLPTAVVAVSRWNSLVEIN